MKKLSDTDTKENKVQGRKFMSSFTKTGKHLVLEEARLHNFCATAFKLITHARL